MPCVGGRQDGLHDDQDAGCAAAELIANTDPKRKCVWTKHRVESNDGIESVEPLISSSAARVTGWLPVLNLSSRLQLQAA